MTRVLITQSMLFPWVGMLEQIRLADIIVHYDDVQFSKGSFTNRVQVKTATGSRWMTVPLVDHHLGQAIDEVRIPAPSAFAPKHLALLGESFAGAPFRADALELATAIYARNYETLGDLARASMMGLAAHFGLTAGKSFLDIAELGIGGSGSERVLAVVKALGGTSYVTGLGALNYLEHERFAAEGISVDCMDYRKLAYPQGHGPFTPYVTGLDLVAWCGREGAAFIASGTKPIKEMLNEPA